MFPNMTRREFLKTTSMAALALAAAELPLGNKVFAADNCTVKTRYGTYNGFVDKQGVKTWLGIPYAQPPVGKLRWQAPQPLKPSNKTRDAKKFGFTAVQMDDANEAASKNPQSEDCLTLNIWRCGEKKNLPVMVFIHGGSFVGGGSTEPLYHGSNFAAAQDVVIVTINYRLNIFGFMNFAAIDPTFEDCGGYLGTKDQIAALAWV
ncbi:MAG: carboxylesterase/lipase family protein, partial [Selenomonadaceae bacterium]|nr:carboxylesterase/lipase family protein [Selenomonadaceae bacterium]